MELLYLALVQLMWKRLSEKEKERKIKKLIKRKTTELILSLSMKHCWGNRIIPFNSVPQMELSLRRSFLIFTHLYFNFLTEESHITICGREWADSGNQDRLVCTRSNITWWLFCCQMSLESLLEAELCSQRSADGRCDVHRYLHGGILPSSPAYC